MVKHGMPLIIFVAIQFHLAVGQSDMLHQKITVSFEHIPLEQLLEFLKKSHNLNFSYSIDNTPLKKEISIHGYDMQVGFFLEMLCLEAGLTYYIIDDQIVLRQTMEKGGLPKRAIGDSIESNPSSRLALNEQLHKDNIPYGKRHARRVKSIKPLPPKGLGSDGILPIPTLPIKNLSLASDALHRPAFNFRRKKMASFAVGLMASYDDFRPGFQERPNKQQRFSQEKNFSIGAISIISPGELFSGTIGILYSTKNYFLAYNYQLNNPEDPIPFPDKTKVYVAYLALPMNLDYRLLKVQRFSLYLSAGILPEVLIREKETTTYLNADKEETSFFKGEHNKFLLGASVGVVLWYDLSKSINIFFKPAGVYYLTSMNDEIMQRPQLLKLSAGMSMRLTQQFK